MSTTSVLETKPFDPSDVRVALAGRYPFYGYISSSLKCVAAKNCPTAGVEVGRDVMVYNPDFMQKLSLEERIGVYCHEVMHAALGHCWPHRIQGRDLQRWNIAADIVVNNFILSANKDNINPISVTLPKGALSNPEWENLTVEEIYNLLPDSEMANVTIVLDINPELSDEANGTAPGGAGGNGEGDGEKEIRVRSGTGMSTSEEEMEAAAEWAKRLTEAAYLSSKGRGTLPGCFKGLVEEILKPKLNLKRYLAKFMSSATRDDYTFEHVDRRLIDQGVYFPDLYGERVEDILIFIDSSGSVGELAIRKFLGIAREVAKAQCGRVRVITCDMVIQDDFFLKETAKEIKCGLGRGGTSFKPPFNYVKEKKYKVNCAIYLTDLGGDFPEKKPPYPTLWVSTTRGNAPFGTTIHVQEEDI